MYVCFLCIIEEVLEEGCIKNGVVELYVVFGIECRKGCNLRCQVMLFFIFGQGIGLYMDRGGIIIVEVVFWQWF